MNLAVNMFVRQRTLGCFQRTCACTDSSASKSYKERAVKLTAVM